jgi:hypothetical protein
LRAFLRVKNLAVRATTFSVAFVLVLGSLSFTSIFGVRLGLLAEGATSFTIWSLLLTCTWLMIMIFCIGLGERGHY